MPLAGKGMLLTSMDIDPSDEAEFNRWYDREHLTERVAIEGFLEARRYVAHETSLKHRNTSAAVDGSIADRPYVAPEIFPKYLSLYSTATFDVLDSPAYRTALANQTDWSKANIARFQNMVRAVARVTISHGQGRGAALGLIRLRPPAANMDKLRAALRKKLLDPAALDGIISMHLTESDAGLSRPIADNVPGPNPGAADWFVLIDGTHASAVRAAISVGLVDHPEFKSVVISTGVYTLLWDLAKSDIPG
jgi:hypothetical protein